MYKTELHFVVNFLGFDASYVPKFVLMSIYVFVFLMYMIFLFVFPELIAFL